jgi:hypothetical protein
MTKTPLANGGLYEVFVGVTDLEASVDYWRAFGYSELSRSRIDVGLGENLYGHNAGGDSVRLIGSADHGLVRLIRWDTPRNAGLGTSGLRQAGSRWVGQFSRSLLTVCNHAAAAIAGGKPLEMGPIHFIDMGKAYAHLFGGRSPVPFHDPLIALREVQIFGPETRQVVLERFGYDSPLLGTFADDSLLKTTQIVQGCMVIKSDDPQVFDFYETVLGLWRSLEIAIPYEEAQASRTVFGLTPGETHWNVDLDEPASKPGLAERRSGRLKCFRFSAGYPIDEVHDLASPGSLGLSNYSWRVIDAGEARSRSVAAGASAVTPIVEDEFGDRAFSMRAPDGYFWTLIEQSAK